MLNKNYIQFPNNYLFAEIANRVQKFSEKNPNADIIRLGIGDVTRPIPAVIVKALQEATAEMGKTDSFKGYGPYEGYAFLRNPIAEYYQKQGAIVNPNDIFINDGAKADTANILEIFDSSVKIAVCDPVYPVYVDSNALCGRAGEWSTQHSCWQNLVYMPCTLENNFIPEIPTEKVDIIYLCFPNNPTGAMITKDKLQEFVDYANENNAVIIYDGAYEAYITDKNCPHSIYQCAGANKCAIEVRSLSKDAGFTGIRSGYTVFPSELIRDGVSVKSLWQRRISVKYNGASYIIQKGAAARFTAVGETAVRELISYYQENAKIIKKGLSDCGFQVFGGVNAPYIWLKTPNNLDSWTFFDKLLNDFQVVGTPGVGFGTQGEGYFRLTAFGTRENTERAVERIKRFNNVD